MLPYYNYGARGGGLGLWATTLKIKINTGEITMYMYLGTLGSHHYNEKTGVHTENQKDTNLQGLYGVWTHSYLHSTTHPGHFFSRLAVSQMADRDPHFLSRIVDEIQRRRGVLALDNGMLRARRSIPRPAQAIIGVLSQHPCHHARALWQSVSRRRPSRAWVRRRVRRWTRSTAA